MLLRKKEKEKEKHPVQLKKMQRVKEYLDKVDTGGTWQKLKDEIAALTDDESERNEILARRVLADFITHCAKASTVDTREKKGKEKEDDLMKKQKGTKKNEKQKSIRRIYEHELEEEEEEEDDEEYYMVMRKKQKKQATGNDKKKKLDGVGVGVGGTLPFAAMGLEPPPNMPEAFQKHIELNLGGTEIKLVSQKLIYPTDVKRWENRLPISMKQVRNKFLSEAEEEEISRNKGGMDVVLVEPCLETSEIHLTKWVIGGSPSYVLNTQWRQVVENNAHTLKERAIVQIWSFRLRSNSRLGLAIIKVGDMPQIK